MNDNYIVLINRFWNSSIERSFNTSDCMLYFYLLNTCNMLHWKQPFGQSDRHLSLMLGVSVPTVRQAKRRLKQRGLIVFKPPTKGSRAFDGQTQYYFPEANTETQNSSASKTKNKKNDKQTGANIKGNDESNSRKSEIVRLAGEAIAACS